MATSEKKPQRQTAAQLRRNMEAADEVYSMPDWLLLFATFGVMALIFFVFTPYTHQLDEIKNTFLWSFTPILLLAALYLADFSKMTWKTHASTMLFGLLIVAQVISFLVNPLKLVAERVLWFQVACGVFTLIFAWFMNSENKLRKVMMFMVLLGFFSALIGLFFYASGTNFTQALYNYARERKWPSEWTTLFFTLTNAKEMYSTILNSDFYAAYLIMTLPITLSMFFVEEHLVFKTLAVVTFLLMCVCLIFTNSNDSLLALVFIMCPMYFVMCFLYRNQLNLSKQLLLTFFGCGVFLALTVFILMLPKLVVTWDFKTKAFAGRKVLWLGGFWPWIYRNDFTATHIDWTSIFFGTGPGGYRFYFPVFRQPDFFDNQINNVTTFGHNYYLDMLLEFGLCGLGLFLMFYLRVLYDGFRQIIRTQNKVHRLYQMAMVTGLCGIALQNFFSPNNRWAVCGMVFYTMFGLSMGLHHLDSPGQPVTDGGTNRFSFRNCLKYAAVVFALIFLVQSGVQGIRYFESAKLNGKGLRYMEGAESYSATERQLLLEKARELFEQAIRVNPTFVTTYYKLGHVYNSLDETEKAIETYERLNEINPHYSEIHLNLGIMYWSVAMSMGQTEEALKTAEKAYKEIKEAARQELKPNVQWRAGAIAQDLAARYERAGRTEDAMKTYEELKLYYWNLINYNPLLEEYKAEKKEYYARSQKEILRYAYLTNKLDEAEKILERMYWEDPSKNEYLTALLAFYDKQGKVKEKITFLEKAVHSDPLDPNTRKRLADAYEQNGDSQGYRKQLKSLEVLDPGNRQALGGIYLSYKKDGKNSQATEYAGKLRALGVDPDKVSTATLGQASASSASAALLPAVLQATKTASAKDSDVSSPVDTAEPQPTSSPAPPTKDELLTTVLETTRREGTSSVLDVLKTQPKVSYTVSAGNRQVSASATSSAASPGSSTSK